MARRTKEDASRTRQQIIDAARQVFHERGVSRTTLEQIAVAAGVTRGAVYWHFANKAELFFAMKEQISLPVIDRADGLLLSESVEDPLDAIEHALNDLFRTLQECQEVRMMFEIVFLRCEYVDEFASVLEEMNKPVTEYLDKLERVYRRALEKGTMNPHLDPRMAAFDTWAFTNGMFHHLLEGRLGGDQHEEIEKRVESHVALRRKQ